MRSHSQHTSLERSVLSLFSRVSNGDAHIGALEMEATERFRDQLILVGESRASIS
jgi:hypothetical protein